MLNHTVSIIIPCYNEVECLPLLLEEVRHHNPQAEIVVVDDGSSDGTADFLKTQEPQVRVIWHSTNLGQSAAMYHGLHAAKGELIAMIDGDGQNDPSDIPRLVANWVPNALVCGYRAERKDTAVKKISSLLANGIRRTVLCDGARDTGCTLKVLHRDDVPNLIPFTSMHRFLPALCKAAGMTIIEIPVNHRPRKAGISKYGFGNRALRGLVDLFGVRWLIARRFKRKY